MQKQYTSDCPVACTLSVIGSSWTCLILRDLLLHDARRFQDLQDSLDGIAPTTLSERLRTLEQHGIVERRFYSMSPPRADYVLTDKGRDLGPIVIAMQAWGLKYASPPTIVEQSAG
jgi:DNA-binding HxlR family transcriptional regulator